MEMVSPHTSIDISTGIDPKAIGKRTGRLRQFKLFRGSLVLVHEVEGVTYKQVSGLRRPELLAVFDFGRSSLEPIVMTSAPELLRAWRETSGKSTTF